MFFKKKSEFDPISSYDDNIVKLKREHIVVCILTLTFISSGAFYNIYNALEEKQNVLAASITYNKKLKVENEKYNSEIQQLKLKAEELENKINELEKIKQDINQKLQDIQNETQGEISQLPQKEIKVEDVQENILAYDQPKTEHISEALNKIENSIAAEEVEFIDIADNVTEKLAQAKTAKTIPSGKPVDGIISSDFSYRNDPINNSNAFHTGLDIAVNEGTPVKATASGTVVQSRFINGYGYTVEIDHGNGYCTLFAHNSQLLVNQGDIIEKGDVIALSGATGRVTGPHVHYEVKLNGQFLNPIDFIK